MKRVVFLNALQYLNGNNNRKEGWKMIFLGLIIQSNFLSASKSNGFFPRVRYGSAPHRGEVAVKNRMLVRTMIAFAAVVGFFLPQADLLADVKKEMPRKAIQLKKPIHVEVLKEADLEIDAVFLENCSVKQYNGQDILVFKKAIVKYSNNGPRDYPARIRFSATPHSPSAPYTSVNLVLKKDVGTVQKALGTQTVTFGPFTRLFKKANGIHISISLRSSEGKDPVSSNNRVDLYGCD